MTQEIYNTPSAIATLITLRSADCSAFIRSHKRTARTERLDQCVWSVHVQRARPTAHARLGRLDNGDARSLRFEPVLVQWRSVERFDLVHKSTGRYRQSPLPATSDDVVLTTTTQYIHGLFIESKATTQDSLASSYTATATISPKFKD